jgi:hypothetical protein
MTVTETITPYAFAHAGFSGRIGTARADITPPIGIYARNWGAATHDTAEGVHRPLTATALTLQTQDTDSAPLVLLSCDLGWWRSFKDEWHVRGFVLDALGLDSANLMIHFTHTHAGPSLCREDADKPGGEFIAPYLDFLRQTLADVVRRALADAVPATLEWHTGRCALAQNRDLPDRDAPRLLSGFHPSGMADDTLLVGRVTTATGHIQAVLVNYACHPTTLAWENRLLSPDWVGAMREIIEAHTDAHCLYLHGASGELAPREQYTADVAVADRNGRQIGYAALSVLEGMLPPVMRFVYAGVRESGASLAVWKTETCTQATHLNATKIDVEYKLKALPTLAELDAQIQACSDRVLLERLRRSRRIREALGDGTTVRMPLWIWHVGAAFFLGHPNEAYSLLQTRLRERFPAVSFAILNVVNGHFGYLPPAALYAQNAYPVWQTPFAQDSLERLIDVCASDISRRLSKVAASSEIGAGGIIT